MLLKEYDLYNSTESFPIVYVGIDSIKMFDFVSSLSVPFELTRWTKVFLINISKALIVAFSSFLFLKKQS